MKKQIQLNKQRVEYTLRKSRRSTRMRLAVYADASFVVSAPRFLPQILIDRFIKQKAEWVLSKIAYFKSQPTPIVQIGNRRDYLKHKTDALALAKERVAYFNQFYNFKFNTVNIKNQKTRWGSCSKKGNLNFNYKIIHLPPEHQNYLVVHELCHLAEFNHSKKFWTLVSQQIPNYAKLRYELKHNTLF